VNVGAYIKETGNGRQFSVLSDRSQGGASLNPGQLEIMIQRRLLADDGRGVGEPLNETAGVNQDGSRVGPGMHVTGTHYLLLDPVTSAMKNLRDHQSRIFQPLTVAFTPLPKDVASWISTHTVSGSAAAQELPLNLDLMTLEGVGGDNFAGLLRLSHQFGVQEDPVYSRPATVDLEQLFSNLKLVDVKEVSLTANQPAENIKTLNWRVKGENALENMNVYEIEPFNGRAVTINPLDIRTFTFKVADENPIKLN